MKSQLNVDLEEELVIDESAQNEDQDSKNNRKIISRSTSPQSVRHNNKTPEIFIEKLQETPN